MTEMEMIWIPKIIEAINQVESGNFPYGRMPNWVEEFSPFTRGSTLETP